MAVSGQYKEEDARTYPNNSPDINVNVTILSGSIGLFLRKAKAGYLMEFDRTIAQCLVTTPCQQDVICPLEASVPSASLHHQSYFKSMMLKALNAHAFKTSVTSWQLLMMFSLGHGMCRDLVPLFSSTRHTGC
jgi:hypothetical protein